jgi:hypothetical protein
MQQQSESDVRTRIQGLYNELLGEMMDTKIVGYWVNSIMSGEKSVKDFENSILISDPYLNKVRLLFKESYYEFVDYNLTDEVIDRYIHSNAKGKRVTIEKMQNYIKELPEYRKKYGDLVRQMYSGHRCPNDAINCPDDVVDFYISKFKSDVNYTVDQLIADMNNGVETETTPTTSVKEIETQTQEEVVEDNANKLQEIFKKVYDREPNGNELSDLNNMTKDPLALVLIYYEAHNRPQAQHQKVVPRSGFEKGTLEAFEKAFNRPMYVQEYFKYNDKQVDFQRLFETHSINYNKLRSIIEMYTGCNLDEYAFVKKYLDAIEIPTFFEDIIYDIVQSPEYKASMSQHIKKRYSQLFDESLGANDIAYVFEKVRILRLNLVDDELNDVLSKVKRETDDIIAHIFEQYNRVLERQPDHIEVEKFIVDYRTELPMTKIETIDKKIERILMNNLEFHDILKKKIRANYSLKYEGREMMVSALYTSLNTVLSKVEDYDMDTIGMAINASIL